MAVELLSYRNDSTFGAKMAETAAEEAATAGLQSVEKLIRILSHQNHRRNASASADGEIDYRAVADVAVNKFRKFISSLDRTRTGHARFRRGPVQKNKKSEPLIQAGSHNSTVEDKLVRHRFSDCLHFLTKSDAAAPPVSAANSFRSSLTVAIDSHQPSISSSGFHITNRSQGGRPPLSSSAVKRKCSSVDDAATVKCGGPSEGCHCSKKRNSRVRMVVRLPAISEKMSDVPPDDFSWRKYGQKPIKGSPHPRGYYRCSSVRDCPARKRVERALDDPTVLIVTYEEEHNHSNTEATGALVLDSS